MSVAIGWYEIPVINFQRARQFYESVLDMNISVKMIGGSQMGFFQRDEGQVGGAIIQVKELKPCPEGVTVYFDCGNDLQPYLDRVMAEGCEVITHKSLITEEIGYYAQFIDSEGNRIALWSKG